MIRSLQPDEKASPPTRPTRMIRVPVTPMLLTWARNRAGLTCDDLSVKFRKLPQWESGEVRPTLKQLEAFARAVHTPVGYLFLTVPPDESVPIPDFRTFAGQQILRPSPNLLDTIYACQERQSWYREYAQISHLTKLSFVGSATIRHAPKNIAATMSETLGFDLAARRNCSTWTDALRLFIRQADEVGILVMVSGVVANNSHRRLDPQEFRGFALSDPLAPLIFVNGMDTKAAQMFTLAHELAHIWLGASALSNLGADPQPNFRREEVWCNAVAAEFLVPLDELQAELLEREALADTVPRLARIFKVSTLVILRRLLDAKRLTRVQFDTAWTKEIKQLQELALHKNDGGNFYHTAQARVSRRFARALVVSTLEGQTLYRDAFRMLCVSKAETFHNIGRLVGATV